jgi:putative CocE/NonD family hydrolase
MQFGALLLTASLTSCIGTKSVEPPMTWSEPEVKDGVSCVTGLVPARDGTKLYTEVYRLAEDNAKHAVIIARSPYARQYGEGCFRTGMNPFPKDGYVAIYQSVRGTGHSEGVFTPLFNDENDGADLIEWAARQPWSNGKVGMTHGSYLGATQWLAAIATPPNLVVITPSITPIDYRDTWIAHNGVFNVQLYQAWSQGFVPEMMERKMLREGASEEEIKAAVKAYMDRRTANNMWFTALPLTSVWDKDVHEAIPFLWEDYRHPSYDAHWAKIDIERQYGNVKVPALISGGWYDLFGKSTVDSYIGMKQHAGTEAARRGTMLVMDCCGHGLGAPPTPGQISWGKDKTGTNRLRDLFLAKYLKGDGAGIDAEANVQLTVLVPPDTGTAGDNFIFKTTAYPVPGTRYVNYHLSSGGKANTANGDGVLDITGGSSGTPDSFLYDPLNPVPTLGGLAAVDQRPVETRDDVLVYTAPPATASFAMIGKISVTFWAQTDGTDTDFTAKLVDVHMDGFAHTIVDRVVRARYRKGPKMPPQLLTPNVPYHYQLDLGHTATLIKPGHRLRLEISSSNFPKFARNLNTGASNEDTAQTRVAHNTILHDAHHPSFVTIAVVEGISQ